MNTQGWIRATMAKNMEVEKFLQHVAECLGREFDLCSEVIKCNDKYIIKLGGYECVIDSEKVSELKAKSPYALDRYLLDRLRTMDFDFDMNRSQYIRYCYNIFN
ncbi:MAG: hypothetical protein ACM3ZR_09035 [Pseudomonadota bacterium]